VSVDPKSICKQFEQLAQKRQMIDADVQSILAYTLPHKANIDRAREPGVTGITDGLYDLTGAKANQVLAAGLMSTATPTSSRWAQLGNPGRFLNGRRVSQRAKAWFQAATEEVMDEIARSNFYTELHEAHLDRNAAGTCYLFMEEGKETFFNFDAVSFGEYVIAEDRGGRVDTAMRKFKLTLRQLVQEFGLEPLPQQLKDKFQRNEGLHDESEIIHAVYPRTTRDPNKVDGVNKPIASCYVLVAPETLLREGGYDEFPGAVSRYLKWPGTVYGFGPGFITLAPQRQVNFIERQLDVLAEKAAHPPSLVPSNLFGMVDNTAGGVTVFDENFPNAIPREWLTGGRYDIGKDRVSEKQRFIETAFHNDLFQMFGQIERQMTAFEAMQRASEKLDLISPSFTRMANELLAPVILRAFRMKLRAGALPPPPEELIVRDPRVGLSIQEPKVVFVSKLALAIKANENRALVELQTILQGPAQVDPTIMDNFNWDKAARGSADNLGLPSEWLRSEEERDAMREARAQQAAQAQQVAMAQGLAKAAKDASAVPEEKAGALSEALGRN